MTEIAPPALLEGLPLFPLQTVLFPGGLLGLKVFEARYLDLMGRCLRERLPFGVVALRSGHEARRDKAVLETTGTLAELFDVDSPQPGILQVRCRGTQRFALQRTWQEADGLWMGAADAIADDDPRPPGDALAGSVRGLRSAIETLQEQQGAAPFLEPFRFDEAGWVANRWCEILPISKAAKQKLMELEDPLVRLQLVDEFLRDKGVV